MSTSSTFKGWEWTASPLLCVGKWGLTLEQPLAEAKRGCRFYPKPVVSSSLGDDARGTTLVSWFREFLHKKVSLEYHSANILRITLDWMCPPQSPYAEIITPPSCVGGVFGRRLGNKSRSSINEISDLIKGTLPKELPLPTSACENTARRRQAIRNQEASLTRPQNHQHLDLGLGPRIVKSKCLVFIRHPVCGILL